MTFEEGDTVTRKTGGPMMTVEMTRLEDGLVNTVWLDADNHVQRDCFAANTLLKWRLVEEQP